MSDALLARRHWIFDLDGTLTVAAHDFDAMRDELGLPRGVGILEALDALPPAEAAWRHARVRAWEAELADAARAEPDALVLLEALRARGAVLGVLTRNLTALAWRTLAAIGAAHHFGPDAVIGRDHAAAKPDPEGILRLLGRWGASPGDAVMVGDFVLDLRAGRSAGVATVLVDRRSRGADWARWADRTVARLDDLLGTPRVG